MCNTITKTQCYNCTEQTTELSICSLCNKLVWLCNTCCQDDSNSFVCNYCIIDYDGATEVACCSEKK